MNSHSTQSELPSSKTARVPTTSSMLCTVTPRLKGEKATTIDKRSTRPQRQSHFICFYPLSRKKTICLKNLFITSKLGSWKPYLWLKYWPSPGKSHSRDVIKIFCIKEPGEIWSVPWQASSYLDMSCQKKCQGVKNLKTMQRRLLNQVGMFQLANS